MSKKLYEESNIQEIAYTIREKNGTQDTYKVSQMAEAMSDLIGPPAYNNMILAQNTEPTSEYNKVWFDTDADDEYTFPQIDDNNVSPTDTWSSQKIKAEDDNLKSAIIDEVNYRDSLINTHPAKNYVDQSSAEEGMLQSDGTISTIGAYSYYKTSGFIKINPSTDYILNSYTSGGQKDTSTTKAYLLYDFGKNIIGSTYLKTTSSDIAINNASAYYIRVSFAANMYCMLEEGDSSSGYEPYNLEYFMDSHFGLTSKMTEETSEIVSELTEDIAYERIGKNLADLTGSETGFIQSNGTISKVGSYVYYKTTDYIEIEPSTNYVLNAYTSGGQKDTSSYKACLLYNSDKNIIANTYTNNMNADNVINNANAKYVRLSFVASLNCMFEKGTSGTGYEPYSKQYRLNEDFPLTEKMEAQIGGGFSGKWWACGDSFTAWTTEQYTPTDAPNVTGLSNYKTYPYWIGKRNPNLAVYNYAVSGQTMAMPANPGDFTNAFSNDLYKSIPSDVDYITLYFGINDSHHRPGSSGGDGESNEGEIPLGTITDNTTATFYGAWNVVLEYLITNYPWAKIGMIITNGAETEDYPQAEIALAKKWGIPYLDLNGHYKLPLILRCNGKTEVSETAVNIRKNQQWTSSSNGHPNVNAHKFESTFIEAWLRRL